MQKALNSTVEFDALQELHMHLCQANCTIRKSKSTIVTAKNVLIIIARSAYRIVDKYPDKDHADNY